ncbi:hypothetical protein [Lutibacter citreus]|uniref:hypothetical protein n=1 Tax=Lutibacter citreus TaxID=2138210 RepID=UPI000DBE3173|nr:hypothetical protein [Lutibacter citreus]
MEKIKFKITRFTEIPIEIPLENQRKFPIHSHYLKRIDISYKIYEYLPTKHLNEKNYKEYMVKYLSEKLTTNKTSVEIEVIN